MPSSKPKKPANYYRNYMLMGLTSLLPIPILLILDLSSFIVPCVVLLAVLLPEYWFKDYYAEKRKYEEEIRAEIKQKYTMQSNVNDNIKRYKEAQKIRRLNARDWEFWKKL